MLSNRLKSVVLLFLFCLLIFSFKYLSYFFDHRTKIVFCNVGQGDASYIRIKNKIDLLIDAGPDKRILLCLGKYMPFWDKKIELAFITHPQKDHFGGYLYLIDRYQIEKIITLPIDNSSSSFKKLKEKIGQKKISILFPVAGDQIKIFGDSIIFYWPKKDFLQSKIIFQNYSQFGYPLDDTNNFSLIFLFQENQFRLLYASDAPSLILNSLLNQSNINLSLLKNLDILKIPHHGSKNGLTKNFLRLANPKVGVISVGKNNAYGHPKKEIIDILKAQGVKIQRTDKDGDIVYQLSN